MEEEHAEWSTSYGDMSNRWPPSKPPAGNFPGGVPPGGAFQKRVFRGDAAPRAAATLFDVGGGLNVKPAPPESHFDLFKMDKLEYLAQTGYPTPACTADNTAAMRTGVYRSGEGWAPKGTFPPTNWQTSTGRVPCSPLYPPQATPLAVSPPASAGGASAAAVEPTPTPTPAAEEEPTDDGGRAAQSERLAVDGEE